MKREFGFAKRYGKFPRLFVEWQAESDADVAALKKVLRADSKEAKRFVKFIETV